MKKLYEFNDLIKGKFIERKNRFLGTVEIEIEGNKTVVEAHVHDPGRLKELLFKDSVVYLKKAGSLKRKTNYDVICVSTDRGYILVNAGFHSNIARAIIKDFTISPFGEIKEAKAEVKHGNSRFDYRLIDRQNEFLWVEVKGCSLLKDGKAMFPDAPTERGTRHVKELTEMVLSGVQTALLILVFADAEIFKPNIETDPEFYKAFYNASAAGVRVYPVKLKTDLDGIYFEKIIAVEGK